MNKNNFWFLLLFSLASFSHATDCSHSLQQLVQSQKSTTQKFVYENFATGAALKHLDEFTEIFNRATYTTGESYEYVVGVLREVLAYEVFTAKSQSGRYIGFTSLYRGVGHYLLEGTIFQGRSLSYMATAMIEPSYQGQGIYGKLNQRRFDVALGYQPELIFTRTQNPRVERGMRSALDKKIEEGSIAGWKLTRIKKEKAYGQLLTPELVTVENRETQHAFDQLNSYQGDAYLLIFEIFYR